MLTAPLPITLDVRKAAARGAEISGTLKPQNLKRFRPLLAGESGAILVDMAFTRDEENRYLIHVTIDANIEVTCQRCLDAMPVHLGSESSLAVVWTDEEAAHLPRHLEPLVVIEPSCDLWEVVEDELILALPQFNYHEKDSCKMNIADFPDQSPGENFAEDKPNPFNVLGQLKPGKKQ
jgi:uncharacterized protein